MDDLADYLAGQIRATGVPILGVCVGDPLDRTTWTIDFDATATDAQRFQAQTMLGTIPTDPATVLASSMAGDMTTMVKALCAVIVDQKLGRALTTADITAVQAVFTKARTYYTFIVNNGL